MKQLLLIFLLVFACSIIHSQDNYAIKGAVVDTSGVPLMESTIMLLDMDTNYVDFTRTNRDGLFEFKKIKTGNYLARATFMGFIPVTLNVSSTGEDVDVGTLVLKEIATELMEVVIKAAKAPIKMRGDTIEYDASTFKVPDGSSVEELLRRLPGIRVDQDGGITSDGQDVTKVTVDGKEFFGSDPKAATKNLPAEGISKVQVFDEKTEEEEITGVEDNSNQNKTMNLELKDDYKSGAFGKVTGGLGTQERNELKGNYNRFNDKVQLSFIGVTNNTGRNGLSWDDYQGFMGSESWQFGDEGIYGFGNGGGFRFISFGGQDDGLESSLQNIFFSGNQSGLPSNLNGGVNFNYDHDKTKITSYYFINRKGLTADRSSEKETFLDPANALEESSSLSETTATGHKAEIEWRQEIDSFHNVKIQAQFAAVDNEGIYEGLSESRFVNEDFNTNTNDYMNENLTTGHLWSGRALLSKKFRSNKRRRMGANASYKFTSLNEDQMQFSINEFFDMAGLTSRQVLDQNYDNIASKNLFRANALYVEPLGPKFALQTFYNYSNRQEEGDREVVDVQETEEILNPFLTRDYSNDIRLNRIGTSLKYSHQGFNLSVGAAFQNFNLKGTFEGAPGSGVSGVVDKVYKNWIPNVTSFFQPFRNSYMNLSYNVSAQEPNIRNLQPVIDNSNPLYLREGNPDLTPQINHNLNLYFNISRPLSGFRVYINASHTFYDDQIISEEIIDDQLITKIRPVNFGGGSRTYSRFGVTIPIKTNKFSLGLNMSTDINNSNAIVNGSTNATKTIGYTPSFRIDITPSNNFSLFLNSSFNTRNTEYNISSSLDQKTTNFRYGAELNTKLFLGIDFSTDFNLRQFTNDRLDLNENVPILNASIAKQFFPGNKMEVRLSIYDAFNKNIAINQFASNYSIVQSNTVTLARYMMLSLTYNIKGMKSDVKKRRRFH